MRHIRSRVSILCFLAAGVFWTEAQCPWVVLSAADNTQKVTGNPSSKSSELGELRSLTHRFPGSAEAHNNLGMALGETGDLDGAIAELETAVRLKPDYGQAYYNLGITYLKKADFRQAADPQAHRLTLVDALQAFLRANELQPTLPGIHTHLGIIFQEIGSREEAVQEFRQAIESAPHSVEAYNNLGTSLANANKFKDAVRTFEKALELDPHSATAAIGRDDATLQGASVSAVVEEWKSAVRVKPLSALAHSSLGYALTFDHQLQAGMEDFNGQSKWTLTLGSPIFIWDRPRRNLGICNALKNTSG